MSDPDRRVRPGERLRAAALVAALTFLYAAARVLHEPAWPTDFDQLWHAARALLRGDDPYGVVGPGRAFAWDWPLYYPLPAVLLVAPLAHFPVHVARIAFSTAAGALLGCAMGARLRTHWPLLLSASYLISTSRTQWAPLLLAAAWLPWLGVVLTAKPNVGLAALAALRDRRGVAVAVGGAAAIVAIATLVRPEWIASWREAIAVAPHIVAPVLMPGGFLLLLAALRIREPEGRLFLALSLVPHTPSLYDLLPLFFIARSLRESLLLALSTHALFWGIVLFASYPTFDEYALGLGRIAVLVVYLPALAMLLLRRRGTVEGAPSPAPAGGWRDLLPANHVDVTLLGLLVIPFFLLVYLPLNSYR